MTEVAQIFLGGLKHVNKHLFAKKTGQILGYCGLRSAISENDTPIGGSHPMLYFPIQITEKYSIVLCYPALPPPLTISLTVEYSGFFTASLEVKSVLLGQTE